LTHSNNFWFWSQSGLCSFSKARSNLEVYLLLKVDEVAERILTLGATPLHTFDDYKIIARIKSLKNVSDGNQGVQTILESLEILVVSQRELLKLSADAGDEGTNALMSDYIREQEKLVWMYSSYLNK
jgi:starvation-inducible DNA-binding protein